MGLLDMMNDPGNRQLMAAGLLDSFDAMVPMPGGRGRGGGSSRVNAAMVQQAEQARLRMEQQEKLRQAAAMQARQQALAQAYKVPGRTEEVETPYGLSPDEMFYDPAEEWGQGAQDETVSLLGLANTETQTTPSRAPESWAEHNQGIRRMMASGHADDKMLTDFGKTLITGTGPQVVAPGGAVLPAGATEPSYNNPIAKVQELEYYRKNPHMKPAGPAVIPGGWKNEPQRFDASLKLGDKFAKHADAFDKTQYQWQSMANAPETGTGDLVLVKGINKMLDPTSTVRESESAEAAAVSGQLSSMMNMYKNFSEGDTLSPSARADLKAVAQQLYEIRLRDYNRRHEATRYISDARGLDEKTVFRGAWDPRTGKSPEVEPVPATAEEIRAELARRQNGQAESLTYGAAP